MTVRAGWLLPGGPGVPGQTREDTRLVPTGTFAPAGELTTRQGVLAGGDPFAASGSGPMDLQLGVGRCVVQGTTAQGAYPVTLDAPVTLSFVDGDAQYDRIDTVIVRVYDGLYDTSGQTLAAVEIVQGTPAAVPARPAMPSASCLPLWDVAVPAGASAGVGGIDWASALSDRRSYTVSHGAVIPSAAPSDTGSYDGQYADMDGVLYRWNAAAGSWDLYRPPAVPVETITTGLTLDADWGLLDFVAHRDGRTITATMYLVREGPTIGGDLNLADELLCRLPAGWWPVEDVEAVASDGYGDGAATVGPDGWVTLRTWNTNQTIDGPPDPSNVRVHSVFIQP